MDGVEIGWSRFSDSQTTRTEGREMYRALILSNHVTISAKAGITHRQLLEQIAQQSDKPIPIKSLPETLDGKTGPGGQVVFGCPGNYFDRIAKNYESMWWWISATGLFPSPDELWQRLKQTVELLLRNDDVGACGKPDRAVIVMHDRGTRFGRTKEHRAADETEQRSCGDGRW
jgi:hypothetical protein